MKRPVLGLGPGLILALACSALPGCELFHHEQRPDAQPAAVAEAPQADEDSTSSVNAVKSTPPKGFFAPTRLSGAWSSEARSIERNLGVQ